MPQLSPTEIVKNDLVKPGSNYCVMFDFWTGLSNTSFTKKNYDDYGSLYKEQPNVTV